MSDKGVCLITGIGPGTGSALVRRFARGGYAVAMLARSADRLQDLAEEIENAHAFPCDVTDDLTETVRGTGGFGSTGL